MKLAVDLYILAVEPISTKNQVGITPSTDFQTQKPARARLAFGLTIIQFLAIFAHRRFDERFTTDIVLMILGIAVAVLRFIAL